MLTHYPVSSSSAIHNDASDPLVLDDVTCNIQRSTFNGKACVKAAMCIVGLGGLTMGIIINNTTISGAIRGSVTNSNATPYGQFYQHQVLDGYNSDVSTLSSRKQQQWIGPQNFRNLNEANADHMLRPLKDLRIVYDEAPCPQGFEPLAGDRVPSDLENQLVGNLNEGTNGKHTTLCYERGSDDDEDRAIYDIQFFSNPHSLPACPSGWETVLEVGSDRPADLNSGASITWFVFWKVKRYIVMCYRMDHDGDSKDTPLYHLRLLNSSNRAPREFEVKPTDLNYDVGGQRLYMAFSRSPSMLAAAVALAGKGNDPENTLDWSEASENSETGEITVTLRLHCQKDGGPELINLCDGRTDLPQDEFERLCSLALEGMEQYWSGPVMIHGITRNLKVQVIDTNNEPNKDADICARGAEFGDGTPRKRSSNIDPSTNDWELVDMTIWYNRGVFPSQQVGDSYYKETAAHEIGHSILFASYGLVHTATHKGTSTILSEYKDDTPFCPQTGDLDVMKYYQGGYCNLDRFAITNWDRAKLLMMANKYTYN